MVDLGTLGGAAYSDSAAFSVNDAGQVVGTSYRGMGGGYNRAFSWTEKGGMVALGTLGGDVSSAAAVNDKGQAVGYSTTSDDAESHAALWQLSHGND